MNDSLEIRSEPEKYTEPISVSGYGKRYTGSRIDCGSEPENAISFYIDPDSF
jgi:hypothetical protein